MSFSPGTESGSEMKDRFFPDFLQGLLLSAHLQLFILMVHLVICFKNVLASVESLDRGHFEKVYVFLLTMFSYFIDFSAL